MDIASTCAKDLMRTNVGTVEETTTVLAAAKIMRDARLSSMVVNRAHDHDAWGIVTRKDIVEALATAGMEDDSVLVGDIMTKPAMTVSPELSVQHCLHLMRMVGVRRLPIVDGDKLVGILSNTDVFEHLVRDIN